MKYIMFEVDSGEKVPVIFSKLLRHDIVATYLRRAVNDALETSGCHPVSAGFYDLKSRAVYGESESLKLKSDPNDAILIDKMVHN